MPPLDATMWAYGVLVVALAAAAIDDVRTGKIHNWITYPAILIGLIVPAIVLLLELFYPEVGARFSGLRLRLGDALIGLLVGFVPMFVAWRVGGVGGGDAKLAAAIGVLAGWKFALATLFYGFAVAGVMALIVMLQRRIFRRTVGRVWWFVVQAVLRNKPDDPSSEDSPTIAIGLALAIGGAIVMVDELLNGPMTVWLFGAG
jgi:Flp pilus assembly protein protease CpaA